MTKGTDSTNRTFKQVLVDVLTPRDARELWSTAYRPVFPVVPQDFSMGGVLPAVLYMMRWGHRRGSGGFVRTFGNPKASRIKDKAGTIDRVALRLAQHQGCLAGFEGNAEQAILADMLLAFCLENKNHGIGRNQPVQRVFPTHYFSSWIDLPETVANLRGIPELIVTVLARQDSGTSVKIGHRAGHFVLGPSFEDNILLRILGAGVSIQGEPNNLRSDIFDEGTAVGIDQLLTIRMAQLLGEAPQKVRGESPEIPNQQPVAKRATDFLYEDLNVFLRAYGGQMPRQSLLPMLESCLSVGLTNVFLSTLSIMIEWERTNLTPEKADQKPWPLFVDCSSSLDTKIRDFSEECIDDLVQRLSRLPICFMCLRILDQRARAERLRGLPQTMPDPSAFINFLGELIHGQSDESRDIQRDIRRTCHKLADTLKDMQETGLVQILENDDIPPVWRLAEAVVIMMGDKLQIAHFRKSLDSCMMIDEPNGIARKRKTTIKGKMAERRSVVLTNTVLDFLVHRHLRKAKKGTGRAVLSLSRFIDILRDHYGFYIDAAPPGFSIPSEILIRNRIHLERRLRDLGLFIGVNDAESMKRLRQRFVASNDKPETQVGQG